MKAVSRSRVSPRASRRGDRGGDPLDGLVNLFDLGIVLAVAFLLAALQSVNLTDLLTQENVTVLRTEANSQTLIVKEGDEIKTVRLSKETVTGSGRRVGEAVDRADAAAAPDHLLARVDAQRLHLVTTLDDHGLVARAGAHDRDVALRQQVGELQRRQRGEQERDREHDAEVEQVHEAVERVAAAVAVHAGTRRHARRAHDGASRVATTNSRSERSCP